MTMVVEVEVTQDPEEARKDSSWNLQRGQGPANSLILFFQPPEL